MLKNDINKFDQEKKLSIDFNEMMMREIGLETNNFNIVDQDTGCNINYEGKQLIAPKCTYSKNQQILDLYNDSKMMHQMFTYFTDKLYNQGEIPDYNSIYNIDNKNGKGKIELKSDTEKIVSGEYLREECKYADLILRINGETNPENILKPFDIPKSKKPYSKERRKNDSR